MDLSETVQFCNLIIYNIRDTQIACTLKVLKQ